MVNSSPGTIAGPTPAPDAGNLWKRHQWSIVRISSPVVLLVAWQVLSATGLIPQDVLPAPQLIFDAGLQLVRDGKLTEALGVSGVRVLEGLLLGGIIGVVLGVAVGLSRWLEATADPPLQMVRALVVAGPEGLAAGEVSRRLATPPSTLSANLAVLSGAGLVVSRRDGRSIIYAADYAAMSGLLGFLMEDCCGGAPEICTPLTEVLARAKACCA